MTKNNCIILSMKIAKLPLNVPFFFFFAPIIRWNVWQSKNKRSDFDVYANYVYPSHKLTVRKQISNVFRVHQWITISIEIYILNSFCATIDWKKEIYIEIKAKPSNVVHWTNISLSPWILWAGFLVVVVGFVIQIDKNVSI